MSLKEIIWLSRTQHSSCKVRIWEYWYSLIDTCGLICNIILYIKSTCIDKCPRGIVHSHCAPGELSINSWAWSIVTRVDIILFNVECPWGRLYSHCAPREISITSWLWNIWQVDWRYCSRLSAPRQSLLSLCPRGTQYHQVAMKYHHQWTVHIVQCWVPPGKSTLIVPQGNSVSPVGYEIIMTSELAPGEVNCHCAPGEYCHHVQRSVLIIPQGKWTSPVECEISSPVDWPYCSMLSTPGEVNCHCAPGEYCHHVQRSVLIIPQRNWTSPVECEIPSPVDWPYC